MPLRPVEQTTSPGVSLDASREATPADAGQPEKAGLVWWHEEPGKPDIRQDVWAVMDTWFGMFVGGAE